ncbi:MAG: hypothetical protein WC205_10945 [Opitutaceae bacterium]|jgi:hypothetical protein
MTPEEQARANAITDSIANSVKQRKQAPATIPYLSPKPPSKSSGILYYGGFLTLAAIITATVFYAYKTYSDRQEQAAIAAATEREETHRQELAEMQAKAAAANAEADRLKTAFRQITTQAPQAASPKIEYNVYHNPTPTPRATQKQPTSLARQTPPPQNQPEDQSEKHQDTAVKYAYSYFRYKYTIGSKNYAVTSLDITPNDTSPVSGWPRYRTEGEAGLEYYDGSGFRRTTRKFEVLTETKNGRIKAIDLTVK